MNVNNIDADKVYKVFKKNDNFKYNEEQHCKLLIKVMVDKNKGCHTFFCVEAMVSECTFYEWVKKHKLFCDIYYFCKMVSKQLWYEEGREIKNREYKMGTLNYEMEHWRLMGWCKFGISKNARIKVNFDPTDSPAKHYEALLKQASEGDFTAAEFKQLMEAVNVGINVHQVFELQNQIDALKSDLVVITANANVQNTFTNKGTSQKD